MTTRYWVCSRFVQVPLAPATKQMSLRLSEVTTAVSTLCLCVLTCTWLLCIAVHDARCLRSSVLALPTNVLRQVLSSSRLGAFSDYQRFQIILMRVACKFSIVLCWLWAWMWVWDGGLWSSGWVRLSRWFSNKWISQTTAWCSQPMNTHAHLKRSPLGWKFTLKLRVPVFSPFPIEY